MSSACEQNANNSEAISEYINQLRRSYTGDSIDKKENAEQLLKKIEMSVANKCKQADEMWTDMEKRIDALAAEYGFTMSPSSFSILDDGCGTAAFTHVLTARGYNVTGIDPDMDSLSLGTKLYTKNTRVIQAYGEQLPLRDESFDLVISKSVLEHVNDKISYMEEIYRTLKKPGIFINVWIPNRWWYLEHHTLLPIYKCFRGREIAIQKHFGLQPYGRIDPPNYFDLIKVMKRFAWKFEVQKGPLVLGSSILSKVANKIAAHINMSKLFCSGWSMLAVKA